MKRALRWFIYILLLLIVLVVIGLYSINPIAKSLAEKRLKEETGMEAKIGKFELGLRSQTLRISNLKLTNPPEFGGSTFVFIPELFVELDAEALRNNKLHLRNLR